MAGRPSLDSTTHVVAHLLREIESALRTGVLEPFREEEEAPDSQQEPEKKNDTDRHEKEIRATLRALKISEEDSIAVFWLGLAGREVVGLAGRAHRNNLDSPRSVDDAFIKFWNDILAVFDVVLDRFEASYLHGHRALDQLINKSSPSKGDANWIKNHVPNNLVAMGDLFFRLKNPEWVQPLKEEGFFDHPLAPLVDEEKGIITYANWPQSRFLVRMACTAISEIQKTVVVILGSLETENISIRQDVVDAALCVPGTLASQLAKKTRYWIETQPQLLGLFPEKTGKLVAHLAAEHETDAALALTTSLLKIEPDPREANDDNRRFWHPRPQTKVDEWHYGLIARAAIPALVESTGMQTLTLFGSLLDTAVTLSRRPDERNPPEDYSHIWRSDIENLSRHGIEDLLVSAVRDVAVRLAENDSTQVGAIVEMLESHQWLVFKRLGLHLLRKYPVSELVIPRLLDRSNFDHTGLWHEYIELAKEQFNLLNPDQQTEILSWIDEERDIEDIKRFHEEFFGEAISDDQARAQILQRKLRLLTPLKDVLPEEWRERYNNWSRDFDKPEYPSYPSPPVRAGWGLDSPKTREELGAMTVDEIASFLAGWERPEDESSLLSPEGLGRELRAATAGQAKTYSAKAELLKGLDPTYVRSFLGGLQDAVKSGKPIDWRQSLSLCRWVVEQPREPEGSEREYNLQDRDWVPARREMVGFLSTGLEPGTAQIIPELRCDVWEVLEPLTRDADPTPDKESAYGKDADWANLSVNTIRCDALRAAIRYALWHKRNIKGDANDKSDARG